MICKAKESAEDLLPLGTQQEKDLPGKCQLVNGHEYYHHPGGPKTSAIVPLALGQRCG